MKNFSAKCFRRRVPRYGGQVCFMKMDVAKIRRVTKSVFTPI